MILKQDNSDKYFPRLIIVPNNQATRENRTSRGGGVLNIGDITCKSWIVDYDIHLLFIMTPAPNLLAIKNI